MPTCPACHNQIAPGAELCPHCGTAPDWPGQSPQPPPEQGPELVQEAIAAIQAGDKQTGRQKLIRVVRSDPRSETAWLWLAETVDDPDKKRECLERVLSINPDNQHARQALSRLASPAPPPPAQETTATQPPPTEEPATPPPPEGSPSPLKRLVARTGSYRLAVIVVGLLLVGACWAALIALRLFNAPEEVFSTLTLLSLALAGVGFLVALVAIVPALYRPPAKRPLSTDFVRMSPSEFEEVVVEVFRHRGWSAEVAGSSGEQGVDINLRREGEFALAQCKHYYSPIGPSMLNNFHSAMTRSEASRGFFVTTSTFSPSARDWVGDKPIELVDRPVLERWINESQAAPETPPEKPRLQKWQQLALWPGVAALTAGMLLYFSVSLAPLTTTPTATPGTAQRQTVVLSKNFDGIPIYQGAEFLSFTPGTPESWEWYKIVGAQPRDVLNFYRVEMTPPEWGLIQEEPRSLMFTGEGCLMLVSVEEREDHTLLAIGRRIDPQARSPTHTPTNTPTPTPTPTPTVTPTPTPTATPVPTDTPPPPTDTPVPTATPTTAPTPTTLPVIIPLPPDDSQPEDITPVAPTPTPFPTIVSLPTKQG
jgi:hypothetical protein